MGTFGTIKTKIIKQLTEAYIEKDKEQINSLIKIIKENKEFLEVYNLYDIVEEKYFDDKEVANLYVEEVSKILKNKGPELQRVISIVDGVLNESTIKENNLYDALDQLLGSDNIRNIDKKIVAKRNVVEFLTTKKVDIPTEKVDNFTLNETLLSTVLINDFNSKFNDLLEEEDKEELKVIMLLSSEEISEKINESKENIREKINILKEENTSTDVGTKLNAVNDRINEMDNSRLSYYKITQLEKDL